MTANRSRGGGMSPGISAGTCRRGGSTKFQSPMNVASAPYATATTPIPVTRPAIITGIGVVAVAYGALATFIGLWNLVLPPLLHVPAEMPGDIPPPLDLFAVMWRYRVLLAGARAALGVLVLLAGWGLLQRRRWARSALEGAVWAEILSYVIIGVTWGYRWHGALYDDHVAQYFRPNGTFK